MRSLVLAGSNLLGTFRKDEEGQDAFEYLLVIGIIMVALVGAVETGVANPSDFINAVMTAVQNAVTGAFA